MEKLPSDRQLSFLSDFFYGVTYPLNALLDPLIRHFLLVGYGDNTLFQIHHTGYTREIVDNLCDTVCTLFAVHTLHHKHLCGNDILQFLLAGLVIAPAATASLTPGTLDQGADCNHCKEDDDANNDVVVRIFPSLI